MTPSPFAPARFPDLPPVAGFTMATAEAGVKYRGRTDLWVLRGDPGTVVAGVYTQNRCPGAPVDHSRTALEADAGDGPQVVVVNSGTANVFAGQAGEALGRKGGRCHGGLVYSAVSLAARLATAGPNW